MASTLRTARSNAAPVAPAGRGSDGAARPAARPQLHVIDGSSHDVDSSEMAFKIAGSMAFKEAMAKADPKLMEPMMKLEIIVPEQYLGDVIGDLTARRGQIQGMESRNTEQVVHGVAPLSEMFGYSTSLRSRTQGRGVFTMQFDHYAEVPRSIAEKVVGK